MRAAIIDDHPIDRLNLRTLLEELNEVQLIGEADNCGSGRTLIDTHRPDFIFLDVRIGRETGFELLESLPFKPRVIFTTLHQEYAFPAFEVEALDFLLKPITLPRLQRSIQRMAVACASPLAPPCAPTLELEDLLVFKQGHERRVVAVSSLLAIIGSGDYTRVLASPQLDYLDQRRMRDWQQLLPPKSFQALDRSTILNLRQITFYRPTAEGGLVTLRNHLDPIPIGPAAFRRLEAILNSADPAKRSQ